MKFNKNANFIYVLADEKIISFCEYIKKSNILYIKKIYILPEYQNKKIGTTMLNYLVKAFYKKYLKIFLYVNKKNFQALKFYYKLQFKKVRSLKKYIGKTFLWMIIT